LTRNLCTLDSEKKSIENDQNILLLIVLFVFVSQLDLVDADVHKAGQPACISKLAFYYFHLYKCQKPLKV
jgi:hypothetical protein